MRKRNTPTLIASAILVLASIASLPAYGADYAISCCDVLTTPSSCWVVPEVPNLGACDPAAELGLCELDASENPISCEPIVLECCPSEFGVVWVDQCVAFEPGMVCRDTVVGQIGG